MNKTPEEYREEFLKVERCIQDNANADLHRGMRDYMLSLIFPEFDYKNIEYRAGINIAKQKMEILKKIPEPIRLAGINIPKTLKQDITYVCKKLKLTEPQVRKMAYALLYHVTKNSE